MSGDLQGAGGVGGLLCVTENPASSSQNPYYVSYDANGNISEYVDDSDSVVAHYEYSPFGKLTSSSGSKAANFNHRFSTKYLDDETNLYYYGFRYYSSELGRWLNREPNEERPLYVFLTNNPHNTYDYLGLSVVTIDRGDDLKEKYCSGLETYADFIVNKEHSGGWIIQHVKITVEFDEKCTPVIDENPDEMCCTNCKKVDQKDVKRNFYEAFKIKESATKTRDAHWDHTNKECTSGTTIMKKNLAWYGQQYENMQGCPFDFVDDGQCVSNTPPPNWSQKSKQTWGTKAEWDCTSVKSRTKASWLKK